MTVATRHAPRRPVTRRGIVAWSIAIACLVVCVASLGIWVASPFPLAPDALLYVVMPLSFGGVGALLTSRVPGNPIGPLLLAALGAMTALLGGQSWSLLEDLLGRGPLPGTIPLALVASLAFIPSVVIPVIGIPLVFPTGRLLGPRWRGLVVALVGVIGLTLLTTLVGAPFLLDDPDLPNPAYREALAAPMATLSSAMALVAVPLFLLTAWSVALRYRRAGVGERQQLRWLVAVAVVAIVAFGVSFNSTGTVRAIAEGVGLATLPAYPIAIGIAVVRYRLYDLDRLISRTIGYALVTLVLLATYGVLVVGLQGLLGDLVEGNTVAVALSTLVAAALFQPLRRRIQRIVDRRFDRARFDAQTLTRLFGERMRDELAIEAVVGDLERTVRDAVRPAGSALWLRERRADD